jgi:hypothetical protein
MNTERPTAGTGSASCGDGERFAAHSACYLATSQMTDVLFDQLEYLLAHVGERAQNAQPCAPNCMDCARLQQAKNWLLMPFHTTVHPPIQ